jgi:hypothetical protein
VLNQVELGSSGSGYAPKIAISKVGSAIASAVYLGMGYTGTEVRFFDSAGKLLNQTMKFVSGPPVTLTAGKDDYVLDIMSFSKFGAPPEHLLYYFKQGESREDPTPQVTLVGREVGIVFDGSSFLAVDVTPGPNKCTYPTDTFIGVEQLPFGGRLHIVLKDGCIPIVKSVIVGAAAIGTKVGILLHTEVGTDPTADLSRVTLWGLDYANGDSWGNWIAESYDAMHPVRGHQLLVVEGQFMVRWSAYNMPNPMTWIGRTDHLTTVNDIGVRTAIAEGAFSAGGFNASSPIDNLEYWVGGLYLIRETYSTSRSLSFRQFGVNGKERGEDFILQSDPTYFASTTWKGADGLFAIYDMSDLISMAGRERVTFVSCKK